jgi:hypothetical protein
VPGAGVDLEKLAGRQKQHTYHANLFQILGGGLSRGALFNYMDVSGIYMKSLAEQFGPEGIASMPSRQARSGRRCRCPAAPRWRSWKSSAVKRRWSAPASQPNSP